jgi:hypothetical protein
MSDVIKDLGQPLLDVVTKKIEELGVTVDEPWKKALVEAGVNIIEKNGPGGLSLLSGLAQNLFNGKAPDLTGLSLRASSDILALMQRKEADEQKEVEDFLNGLLKTLGEVLVALLKAVAVLTVASA